MLQELDEIRRQALEFRELVSTSEICSTLVPDMFKKPLVQAPVLVFSLNGSFSFNERRVSDLVVLQANLMQEFEFEEPKPVGEWLPPEFQKPRTAEQFRQRMAWKQRVKNILDINVLWKCYP